MTKTLKHKQIFRERILICMIFLHFCTSEKVVNEYHFRQINRYGVYCAARSASSRTRLRLKKVCVYGHVYTVNVDSMGSTGVERSCMWAGRRKGIVIPSRCHQDSVPTEVGRQLFKAFLCPRNHIFEFLLNVFIFILFNMSAVCTYYCPWDL